MIYAVVGRAKIPNNAWNFPETIPPLNLDEWSEALRTKLAAEEAVYSIEPYEEFFRQAVIDRNIRTVSQPIVKIGVNLEMVELKDNIYNINFIHAAVAAVAAERNAHQI